METGKKMADPLVDLVDNWQGHYYKVTSRLKELHHDFFDEC
jgi:hypothetical protein